MVVNLSSWRPVARIGLALVGAWATSMSPPARAADAPADVSPTPRRSEGVVLPSDYQRGSTYRFFATYDDRLGSWTLSTFEYGMRWTSQVPHAVALRDSERLGVPAYEGETRMVYARIAGRAWVRVYRQRRGKDWMTAEPRLAWTTGYVADPLVWKATCHLERGVVASGTEASPEPFMGVFAVGGVYEAPAELSDGGWAPTCLAGTSANFAWANEEKFDAIASETASVVFRVDSDISRRQTSPFQEVPGFTATVLRATASTPQ